MEIALNSYSVRNEYDQIGKVDGLIKLCTDLGIKKVEFLDRHFSVKEFGWDPRPDNQDEPQPELGDAIGQMKDAGIEVFSLGPHVRLLCGEKEIEATIEDAKRWIDICAAHGVPMMRGSMTRDAGGLGLIWPPLTRDMFDDDEEFQEAQEEYMVQVNGALERISLVLEPVLAHAEKKGVTICQETHHSYSSNYVFMRKVLDKFPSENYGLAYDFGNYENDDLRWKMLEHCGERVKYWHAKCYAFDDKGFETTLDYPRAIKLSHEKGFDGNLSIEFEGKFNGVLGVYRTVELLKYCMAALEGKDYQMKTEFPPVDALMARFG